MLQSAHAGRQTFSMLSGLAILYFSDFDLLRHSAHFALQGAQVQAQFFCRLTPVPAAALQRLANHAFFKLHNGLFQAYALRSVEQKVCAASITQRHKRLVAKGLIAVKEVVQFTHVAGPGVLLDRTKGDSQADKWQNSVADFFGSIKRFSPAEIQKFKDAKINTDKFLKQVQLPVPSYK